MKATRLKCRQTSTKKDGRSRLFNWQASQLDRLILFLAQHLSGLRIDKVHPVR